MLFEEQVVELLKRCEKLVGKELSQIRGDLKSAQTRGAAVWELLVIEASAHLGALQHEPRTNGTLDIQVTCPGGRTIWVEATYLKPKLLDEMRKSDAVKTWFFQEASRRRIPLPKISVRFEGQTTKAGTARVLPELGELPKFLTNEEVRDFFEAIEAQPNASHTCTLSRYTISVTYTPLPQDAWVSSSELAMESAKTVKQHAVYLKLKKKAKQVSVAEPVIVCVGSDRSPALSNLRAPGSCSIRDVVMNVFREHSSLAAVVFVSIGIDIGSLERRATCQLWTNASARYPLSDDEIELLSQMNFNRWRYTYPFADCDRTGTDSPMTGTLTTRVRAMEIEVEIPSSILIEFLAGRTCLSKSYNWEDSHVIRALEEGWSISACSLKEGSIESAQAPKIVLKLVSPPRGFGVKRGV